MIVNGRAITKEILAQVRSDLGALGCRPVMRAIVYAPSAATESYLRIKKRRARDAGMDFELVRLAEDIGTEGIIEQIQRPGADAVIVQLPLPEHIDTVRVLDAIPRTLDADVLSARARDAYAAQEPGALMPPVVAAVAEILERAQVRVQGMHAIVVGSGWLVGAPAAHWLRREGARVEVLTKEDADMAKLKDAELIISGAGSPGLIRPEHLAPGVVLIDAGTSESGGQVVGDADPACADIASIFTPVPGGVGPIAVACLFQNAAQLILAGADPALRNEPKALE